MIHFLPVAAQFIALGNDTNGDRYESIRHRELWDRINELSPELPNRFYAMQSSKTPSCFEFHPEWLLPEKSPIPNRVGACSKYPLLAFRTKCELTFIGLKQSIIMNSQGVLTAFTPFATSVDVLSVSVINISAISLCGHALLCARATVLSRTRTWSSRQRSRICYRSGAGHSWSFALKPSH